MSPGGPPAQAREVQRAVAYRLYWVGSSFDGLPLTGVIRHPARTSFLYGTCNPAGSDSGCAARLEIQVSSICASNALVLDIRPRARFTARDRTVLDYGEGRLELNAGTSHVTVSASDARGRRAIAALRSVAGAPRLPAPHYPRYYVDQLRRVRDAYVGSGSLRAVRDELGISKSAVRFELGLARELGRARLRRGRGANSSLEEVKRDWLAATMADSGDVQPAAATLGTSAAELRARAKRGRARRTGCQLEPAVSSSRS